MKANFRAVRPILSFLVAAIFGWLVWQLSVPIVGEIEPWDSPSWYYSKSMVVLGFVAALICPRLFWLAPLGLCLGQISYMGLMYHPTGPAIMPSWIGVPLHAALPAMVGAGVAFGLVKLWGGIIDRNLPVAGN